LNSGGQTDGIRLLAAPVPYEVGLPEPRVIETGKKARQAQLQRQAQIRRQYKAAGRAHARTLARLMVLFLVLASAATLVVWRSARIAEMSFVNAGLRRQIGELDKQNGLLQDQIAKKASLETTRAQAAERLGMQKANAGQVHYLSSIYYQRGGAAGGQVLLDGAGEGRGWMAVIEDWVRGQEASQAPSG